jgi:hypothetical protein
MLIEGQNILIGERVWLVKIVDNLLNHDLKNKYADWLAEQGDERSGFLKDFVSATKSMSDSDFPSSAGIDKEWLELIGFELMKSMAEEECHDFVENIVKLARPALRMNQEFEEDVNIPVGASKIGGLPDLPPNMVWPLGEDCKAIYNDDTKGVKKLAGFLGQINLSEISHAPASKGLPTSGILSFFSFQDIENDNPDVIGVAAFLSNSDQLKRTSPPGLLSEGNQIIPAKTLLLKETLDLPETYDGPWSDEFGFDTEEFEGFFDHFRNLNFDNILGYGRATTGGDPTPNKNIRHLILLVNSVGCRLHIQLSEDDLVTQKFDKLMLSWVDFD